MAAKVCTHCQQEKEPNEFYSNKTNHDGLDHYCMQCRSEYKRTNLSSQKSYLRRQYGLTVKQYEEMLEQQGGVCAICKRPEIFERAGRAGSIIPRLAVDHDHKNNVIRGLLCMKCNQGIGCFEDDMQRMEAAIQYLRTSTKRVKQLDMFQPGEDITPYKSKTTPEERGLVKAALKELERYRHQKEQDNGNLYRWGLGWQCVALRLHRRLLRRLPDQREHRAAHWLGPE